MFCDSSAGTGASVCRELSADCAPWFPYSLTSHGAVAPTENSWNDRLAVTLVSVALFAGTFTVTEIVFATELLLLPLPLLLPLLNDAPLLVVEVVELVEGGRGKARNCGVEEPFSKVRRESASAFVGGNGHRDLGLENWASSLGCGGGGVPSTGTYPSGNPFVKTSFNAGKLHRLPFLEIGECGFDDEDTILQ